MGSQQLFLLVLAVLLVSLAIFTGFRFTNDYFQNSYRDTLLNEINTLHNSAVQYRKKMGELGGGSGSYKGWSASTAELKSNGSTIEYTIYDDRIIFMAMGNQTGWDGENGVKTWVRFSEKNGKTVRFLN